MLKTHTHQAWAGAGLAEVTNPSHTIIHTKRERERGLHVLDLSTWTCFALNKAHALFKDVKASM